MDREQTPTRAAGAKFGSAFEGTKHRQANEILLSNHLRERENGGHRFANRSHGPIIGFSFITDNLKCFLVTNSYNMVDGLYVVAKVTCVSRRVNCIIETPDTNVRRYVCTYSSFLNFISTFIYRKRPSYVTLLQSVSDRQRWTEDAAAGTTAVLTRSMLLYGVCAYSKVFKGNSTIVED